ncbi:MAG: hypothetical protein C4576_05765 [Desulfobacteraceae bacterium]|nr:MAG: hypothetical protein C4576_05765 [Desulfobacteraceae bacterium]
MSKPVSKDVYATPKTANKRKTALGIARPAKRFARNSAAFVKIVQAASRPPAASLSILPFFHSIKLGNESCQQVEFHVLVKPATLLMLL